MKKIKFNFSINMLKLLIASEMSTHLTDLKGLAGMWELPWWSIGNKTLSYLSCTLKSRLT